MRKPEWDELPDLSEMEQVFEKLQRRDWELWSIALLLFTAFAGGLVIVFYAGSAVASPSEDRPLLDFFWMALYALVALVVLLNAYLIERKRSLSLLWRRYLVQSSELEQARQLASLDPLTQVYSRRYFDETVGKEVQRCNRTRQPLSFVRLGILQFEEINQERGHLVGDEVLQRVAVDLRDTLRASDMIFRYAGDEFVAMLPDTPGPGAERAVERLRERLGSDETLQAKVNGPLHTGYIVQTYEQGLVLDQILQELEQKDLAA